MKISYKLLSQLVQPLPSHDLVAATLTRTGLEVEGVESVEKIPGGLKGVVVGHVLECAKHPDADRLSITKVNLGEGEPVQIVCGAPNVAAGQKVLVATVGTTLYPSSGEAFTIKKSKIRGAESIGMICAEDELGLGASHDGILILPEETEVGTPAAVALNIESDACLEIGITPNRTDALSHAGVARDFAAAWNLENAEKVTLTSTEAKPISFQQKNWKLDLHENTECSRYAFAVIKGIENQETPTFIKETLAVIGVKSVNLCVDVTNYVQHELGQPLHVFKANDFSNQTITVRNANTDEALETLDGVSRKLTSEDVVISNQNEVLCMGGVMGGKNAGVSAEDSFVVFESACFNAVRVRKSAKRNQIHSDSSFRFERGVAVDGIPNALARAWELIQAENPNAELVEAQDIYPVTLPKTEISVQKNYLKSLLGIDIPSETVVSILNDLQFEVTSTEDGWKVLVPYNRVEVTRPADVAEEVLRIYGYDKVELPSRMTLSLNTKGKTESLHFRLADLLVAEGYTEIMNMSLTKSKYAEAFDAALGVNSVSLLNPLSKDLSHMRSTLLFGGMESISLNEKHRATDLRLFEIGKEYRKTENGYKEKRKLALWLCGKESAESWKNSGNPSSLGQLRAAVENILNALGIQQVDVISIQDSPIFAYGMELSSQKKSLVKLGRVNGAIQEMTDVEQEVFYAEFDFDTLEKLKAQQRNAFQPLNKFPWVRRDLSLLLNKETTFEILRVSALKSEKKLLKEVNLFDVYEGKNLPEGKKSYALKFILQDAQQTLTDEVVEKSMQRILQGLQTECSAELR